MHTIYQYQYVLIKIWDMSRCSKPSLLKTYKCKKNAIARNITFNKLFKRHNPTQHATEHPCSKINALVSNQSVWSELLAASRPRDVI